MMEGSDNWILKLVECFILFLFILVQSTCAQEEFVSIACCADSNFNDQNININWTTDNSWFPNRTGCRSVVEEGLGNHEGYVMKARIFTIDSGKRCYNLTTIEEQDYLVRATFLFADSLNITLDTSFDVLVGVTPIGRVNSSKNLEVEGIFRAAKDHIDFCLEKVKGDPYISKLELRPLENLYYLKEIISPSVLKVISRIDVGGGAAIRYPEDESDRIWKPLENSPPAVTNLSSFPNDKANNVTAPNLKVLLTALNHSERLEFREDLDKHHSDYRVILYFLELNGNVKSGERVFDIYINNDKLRQNFDILANGSNYKEVALDVKANGSLNMTLVKASGGVFGPICNAYEILQVHPWVKETNQKDVDVALNVRNELLASNQENELLKSWSGDPCLPNPWHGLGCEPYNGSVIITSLDLSSSELQGSIPPSIAELAKLKTLNLSYNCFNGSIPEFPAFSVLESMDIRHNQLTRQPPESLISLPHLESLYYGCNRYLDKKLQPRFNESRLRTDSGRCDSEGRTHKPVIVIGVACGSFLFTIVVGIVFVCIYRRRLRHRGGFDNKEQHMVENILIYLPSKDDISTKSIAIEKFTLASIEAATEKYKTLIGEGGFGSVFHGMLLEGQEVAVKVRSAESTQGTREFENELNLLSEIRHENLVPLLGYCSENDQQILVYPFMSNGSLQDRLYGDAAKRKTLDWPTRLSIALGAARGLQYLHTFAGRCIIHRDVKSSNILLDHTMCAKVADFGFSKYAPQEGDSGVISLEVRGTAGYLDPEYYTTQQLSVKSDVFSFGVVLLEIVTGREPLNIHRPRNEWSLVEWATPYLRDQKIDEIVDPSIRGGYHAEAMWRVVEAAQSCIETSAAYRPFMANIVRELEDALIIENNASEYMKSIDSLGTSNSNRFSVVMDKRIALPPMSTPSEPLSIMTQQPSPPQPR
ncbi:hypothetical protein F2P56_024008 [Juglans regia]|uniref:non-specific serine/threonine protein kinase n=2 Tax=Juglans regia TaxID=51240 RepID=A0A6P9FAD7_JUGRE|nr:nodulation receptor kinase-like [Juglans regia]KAF5454335.1 hypothetical protein F2P56_024008 [Juglans regia]